jgi:hypothetical protein
MTRYQHEGLAWTLYGSGAMPLTLRHAPILLKLALVCAFKFKQGVDEDTLVRGVAAGYMPVVCTFIIWFLLTLPSLCIDTKNNTASICYAVFGNLLFISYIVGLSISIVLAPHTTVFLGGSAAVHFAWFVSKAHHSALHGANLIQSCLYGVICIWMYYCVFALPECLHIADFHFLIYMWVPEGINWVLNWVTNKVCGFLLHRSTCWRLVGDKDD